MGRSTSCDMVPFVYHGAFEFSGGLEDEPEEQQMLFTPEEYSQEELCDNPKDVIEVRGWRWLSWKECQTRVGKNERIHGEWWVKDTLRVCIVNESEYSNVAEYYLSVVANDRSAVEQFVKDFQLKGSIDENDAIQQTN